MTNATDLIALLEHKVEIDMCENVLFYNVKSIRDKSVGVVVFAGDTIVCNFFMINCDVVSTSSWYKASKTDIKAIAGLLNDLGNA